MGLFVIIDDMKTHFDERAEAETPAVIEDVLAFLKLRRGRPDATGARVAAIGRVQALLEQQRDALAASRNPEPEMAA